MEHAEIVNQNVFGPDQALADFSAGFLDEDACRYHILGKIHPAGPFCPHCRTIVEEQQKMRFWKDRYIKCYWCHRTFTARTGTILAGKNFSYREIMLLAWMIGRRFGNQDIAQVIGCNRESVRLWKKNFEIWTRS